MTITFVKNRTTKAAPTIPTKEDVEQFVKSQCAGNAEAIVFNKLFDYLEKKKGCTMVPFMTEIERLVNVLQRPPAAPTPPSAAATSASTNHKSNLERTAMCKHGNECPRYDVQTETSNGCWYAHKEEELRCYYYATTGCTNPYCALKHTRISTASIQETAQLAPESGIIAFEGERPPVAPSNGQYLEIILKFPFVDLPSALSDQIGRNREEATNKGSYFGREFLSARYSLGFGSAPLLQATALKDRRTNIQLYSDVLLVEVSKAKNDIQRYDIGDAIIKPTGGNTTTGNTKLYAIECHGLSEKRPSVLRGDAVLAIDNCSGAVHKGYIHQVCSTEVHVSFHRAFRTGPNTTHLVKFTAPMTTYNRQYFAIHNAPITLSPDVITNRATADFSKSYVIPESIGSSLNPEQGVAVKRIAGFNISRAKDAFGLFVLHGPPGTGKTTTLVAAIISILMDSDRCPGAPRTKLLICTPTNHAANLIVEKIASKWKKATRAHLIRLVADGVETGDVPKALVKKFFATRGTVGLDELLDVDIVVTTIVSSGMLYQCGVPTDHFDHIIIDEAGQATAPELAIALLMAGGKCPLVTLAGDHKQLGPVLRSIAAASYGLEESSMELIMRNSVFREKHSIRLLNSYRAHPDIMKLYNDLNYEGRLISQASPEKTGKLLRCPVFPTLGVPVGFIHVEGQETRERDSPSWMNVGEITCVTWLIKLFLDSNVGGLSASDIVVLSPYQKQCKMIRDALKKEFPLVADTITVCSIESFQGREATLVILSCVRSVELCERDSDVVQGIGFLSQPKRLNVAISRAIAGLYVVGNVGLLQTDTNTTGNGWKCLIERAAQMGAIRDKGRHLTPRDVQDLGERYTSLLRAVNPRSLMSVQSERTVDAPWRRPE